MNKDTNKKTTSPKNYRFTATEVASVVKCSPIYVKQVRAGLVNTKSALTQRIIAVDEVLYNGSTKLLKEVERILSK